jgi:hypothetical protein
LAHDLAPDLGRPEIGSSNAPAITLIAMSVMVPMAKHRVMRPRSTIP